MALKPAQWLKFPTMAMLQEVHVMPIFWSAEVIG